jgi:VanZ family protein
LAWAWAGLIVYASLFPFDGWRWPPGLPAWQLLGLPWPRYFIPFDITGNLLAYAPLGALVAIGQLRQGLRPLAALVLAMLLGAGLSYAMELTQQLLPPRVPSLLDWVLNFAGATLGALLAWLVQALGLLRRWQAARDRFEVQVTDERARILAELNAAEQALAEKRLAWDARCEALGLREHEAVVQVRERLVRREALVAAVDAHRGVRAVEDRHKRLRLAADNKTQPNQSDRRTPLGFHKELSRQFQSELH